MPTTAKGTPYVVSTDLVANYPTVSSDLADHIDDNVTYNAQSINAQTGTTYTFALADATLYKLVTATNAAASTYTVPPQSSVTWVAGAVLRILNQGAGAVTLTPGSGVTLNGATLVLSQYQYAELHRTASDTWTITGIATPPGLVKITDSTFTASSAVNINNCFSSTYQHYRVLFLCTPSTNLNLSIRLRASGTDASGSNYSFGMFYNLMNAATPIGANQSLGTALVTLNLDNSTNTGLRYVFDVFSPNETVVTSHTGSYTKIAAAGSDQGFFSGFHTLASAYDGISFFTSTGNITGTVRVYGYRN